MIENHNLLEQLEHFVSHALHRLHSTLGGDFQALLNSFINRDSNKRQVQRTLSEELQRINAGQAEYLTPEPPAEAGAPRPLALILFSEFDYDELLYTPLSVYAHLLNISRLSEHFRCVCKIINHLNLSAEIREAQEHYAQHELAYVHVTAHGIDGGFFMLTCDEGGLSLSEMNPHLKPERLSVTFEVCTVGDTRYRCLAQRFSALNPGVLTFAPLQSVMHSAPLVSQRDGWPYVGAVLHLPVELWPRDVLEEMIGAYQEGEDMLLEYEPMERFCSRPIST